MMSPLVAVGVGNSTIRVGCFTGDEHAGLPIPSASLEFETQAAPQVLAEFLPQAAARWRVASVHRVAEERLHAWVERCRQAEDYRRLTYQDLPLEVCVPYPERVGMDRLVAAVAANRLRSPDRPAVVVDAGTAITVNWLDAAGRFQGGAILPSIRLSAAALAEKTDRLPLVDAVLGDDVPHPLGQTTEAAISSGLFWGFVGAVRQVIERLQGELGGAPEIFVTGGGARKLTPYLQTGAVFVPHLVLCGIALADAAAPST